MKALPNVSWHKVTGKYAAYANLLGKRHHLGLFSTEADAEEAARQFKIANDIELNDNATLSERVVYVDGDLVWRQHGRGHNKGQAVGSVDKISGYRSTRDADGRKAYVHRLVWQLAHGAIAEGLQVDHINGRRDDNQIENLRLVTGAGNCKNARLRVENTTGCPGVSRLPGGRFLARISSGGGRTLRLGSFATQQDAVAARKAAEPALGYHQNHGRTAP